MESGTPTLEPDQWSSFHDLWHRRTSKACICSSCISHASVLRGQLGEVTLWTAAKLSVDAAKQLPPRDRQQRHPLGGVCKGLRWTAPSRTSPALEAA